MDDWQDQALTQKRIPHGRFGKGKGKGPSSFDVKKTFGAYTLAGKALDRAGETARLFRSFEIHGLDDTGEGLMASFSGTGMTTGVALLSGSRKVLERLVAENEETTESVDRPEAASTNVSDQSEGDDESASPDETEEADRKETSRFTAFEKNSFRNPKFWMQWKAPLQSSDEGQERVESNRAYIIFSGNDCKTFKGTLSSAVLGWKDVAVTGRKVTTKAPECQLTWNDISLPGNVGVQSSKPDDP